MTFRREMNTMPASIPGKRSPFRGSLRKEDTMRYRRSFGSLACTAVTLLLSLSVSNSAAVADSWSVIPSPPGDYVKAMEAGETYLFVRTSAGLFRTPLEEPGEWESLGNLDGNYVTDLLVAGPDDSHILATTDNNRVLYRSTDGGQTWTYLQMSSGATSNHLAWNGVFPGRVYFRAREISGDFRWYTVLMSTDFGDTWSVIWSYADRNINFIEAAQGGSDVVYLGEWLGSMRTWPHKSTDAGETWIDLSPMIDSESLDEAAVSPTDPDALYVFACQITYDLHRWKGEDYLEASEVGIYGHGLQIPSWGNGLVFAAGGRHIGGVTHAVDVKASADDGETWFLIREGLGHTMDHWSIRFDAARSEPLLFVSAREVLWMREFDVSSADDHPAALDQLWVSETHPNPAEGGVRLRFDGVVEPGARVDVFDPSGRRIRGIPVGPGARTLVWDGRLSDGRPAPSGIYFIRIENGRQTLTRRVTLVH
jgi:photosystem II stability/assembly factor-like uncharacterized protein